MSDSNEQKLAAFLDEATLFVKAGNGGDGMAHFHREKFVPRGGPDGGDGAPGGSVVLEATSRLSSLLEFKYQHQFKAEVGGKGGTNNRVGAAGADLVIPVPAGTQIFDADSGELLADLRIAGSTAIVASGGRGGRGNASFTDPVHQAPTLAEMGEPGEERNLRLELKLLADVGLLGLPNAGKSSLITQVSRARPKIANYPFTTLKPHLGVVKTDQVEFTMADLPGLIEGASEGAGLGHDFLRHLERCGVLVHVVDCSEKTPEEALGAWQTLRTELERYDSDLARRPEFIVLNKFDLWAFDEEAVEEYTKQFKSTGRQVFCASTATGWGLDSLINTLGALVDAERAANPVLEEPQHLDCSRTEAPLEVNASEEEEDVFLVSGGGIEKFLWRVDFTSTEALYYLHKRMQRIGVIDKLRALGAREGSTVRIGEFELQFTDMPLFD